MAYAQARSYGRSKLASSNTRAGMVITLLGALLTLAAVVLLLDMSSAPPDLRHVLVVDSGSSGTRMYAFRWSPPVAVGALPDITAIPPSAAPDKLPKSEAKGMYNRVETRPGLDSFVSNPSGLRKAALGPLLAWAGAVVPGGGGPAGAARSPLFLFATGGVRRMPAEQQGQLMGDVRDVLAGSGFRFERKWAHVISGVEEAVYGWVALNYMHGKLALPGHHQRLGAGVGATSHRAGSTAAAAAVAAASAVDVAGRTLGALDLGGSTMEVSLSVASTQAGELPKHLHPDVLNSLVNITLAGVTHWLHTHTYHRYGLNEAYDAGITLLIRKRQADLQRLKQHRAEQELAEKQHIDQELNKVLQQKQQQQVGSVSTVSQHSPQSAGMAGDDMSPSATSSMSPSGQEQQPGQLTQQDIHGTATSPALGAAVSVQGTPGLQQQQPQGASAVDGTTDSASPVASTAGHQGKQEAHPAAVDSPVPVTLSDSSILGDLSTTGSSSSSSSSRDGPSGKLAAEGSSRSTGDRQVGSDATARGDSGAAGAAGPTASTGAADGAVGASGEVGQEQPMRRSAMAPPAVEGADRAHTSQGPAAAAAEQATPVLSHGSAPAKRRLQAATGTVATAGGDTAMHNYVHGGEQQLQQGSVLLADRRRGRALSAAAVRRHNRQQRRQLLQHLLVEGFLPALAAAEPLSGPHILDPWLSAPVRHAVSSMAGATATSSSGSTPFQLGEGAAVGGLRRLQRFMLAGVVGDRASCSEETLHHRSTGSSDGARAAGTLNATASTHPSSPGDSNGGQEGDQLVLHHPCLHTGFDQPYTRIEHDGHHRKPAKVLLRGAYHWGRCQALVRAVVNASRPCPQKPHRAACRLGASHPSFGGNFVALTGFFVVSKFLGVSPTAALDELEAAAQQLCQRPWGWMESQLAGHINKERYCTWGPYVVLLLREGLQLGEGKVVMGPGDVGWPLGAALVEASKLPDMVAPGGKGRQRPAAAAAAASAHNTVQGGGYRVPGLLEASRRAWGWAVLLFGVVALVYVGLGWVPQRGGVPGGGGGSYLAGGGGKSSSRLVYSVAAFSSSSMTHLAMLGGPPAMGRRSPSRLTVRDDAV